MFKDELITRIIFGSLLGGLALFVLLTNNKYLLLIVTVLALGLLITEYNAMLKKRKVELNTAIMLLVGIGAYFLILLFQALFWFLFAIILVAVLLLAGMLFSAEQKKGHWLRLEALSSRKLLLKKWYYYLLAIVWLGTAPAVFYLISRQENGAQLLIFLTTITACSDIGGYFGGKRFGKYKLAAKISPGKTIEGSIASLVCSAVVGLLSSIYIDLFSLIDCLFLALMISASAQLGDLWESYFKRQAKVKDSGWIIPGHGGILDRLDGFLFSTIVFYYYLPIN